MTRSQLILLVIVSAGLSAGLTAWVARALAREPEAVAAEPEVKGEQGDFHDWLHQQLELTADQKESLAPIERRFEAEHAQLSEALAEASAELAHALGNPGETLESLRPIMTKRQQLQARLQELTVKHLLEKRERLTPAQQEDYRKWVHESIGHDHGN